MNMVQPTTSRVEVFTLLTVISKEMIMGISKMRSYLRTCVFLHSLIVSMMLTLTNRVNVL